MCTPARASVSACALMFYECMSTLSVCTVSSVYHDRPVCCLLFVVVEIHNGEQKKQSLETSCTSCESLGGENERINTLEATGSSVVKQAACSC